MGIENRDYFRGSSSHGASGFGDMPVVCKRLMIATVVVFLAQMVFTRPATVEDARESMMLMDEEMQSMRSDSPEEFDTSINDMMRFQPQISIPEEFGKLDPDKVAKFQVWRLVSYAFLHDRYGIWHLIVNMLFLFWFGSRLEQMYGSREFALFYFASAIAAGVAFLALDYYTGSPASAIGASGAVWGLIALYVIHYPYERIHVYFLFPVEIRWLALLYLIYDLHPVLLALNGETWMMGGVAHAAHLGGAAFGFTYYFRSWRLTPLFDRLTGRKPSGRWQTRTIRREPRDVVPFDRGTLDESRNASVRPRIDPTKKKLEAQLDQVLEKIQTEGRDALTDDEVQVLEQASRQFRNR